MPVILISSITGGIYVFKSELESILYRDTMFISPSGNLASLELQKQNALKTLPSGSTFFGLSIFPETDRANQFFFRSPDKKLFYVYVNPYDASVLGVFGRYELFFSIVLKIHRTLFAGVFGRILVELAAGWGIVLVLTGLFLWLPRRKEKIWGVLLPRLKGKKYALWRDWHTVTGFYLSIFALLVLFSGLVFSYAAGKGIRSVIYASGGFPKEFLNPPKSNVLDKSRISLDGIYEELNTLGIKRNLRIFLGSGKDGSYVVRNEAETTNPLDNRQFYFDSYSGELLKELNASNVPTGTIITTFAYPIHVGSVYGLPTKIIAFLVCLVLIFGSVSGVIMWWTRRPKGKLGKLERPKDFKVPKWIVLIICTLGVLIPTVGISIFLILTGDWIWQKFRNRRSFASF